jgi:hypothetical protein
MKTTAKHLTTIITFTVMTLTANSGVISGGRDLEDNRDFSFRLTFGQISDFNVAVEETTRKLYDVTGSYWKQDDAESYNLDDFNIDDSYFTMGFSLEKAWRLFTFQLDASLLNIESSTVAQRNYYISVGDSIEYNGQDYDNMRIAEGTPFDFDINGGSIDTKLFLTPFTFRPSDGFSITPLLGIGLFGFLGFYDIDAGPATGVYPYQDPIEYFVMGGEGSGTMGTGIPEYGGGAEMRFGSDGKVNLVFQGHYMICQYDGSTSFLVSSNHRAKNIDLDHTNVRGRLYLEIPLKNSRSITLGAQYQNIETTAFIESTATDPEEILEKQADYGCWYGPGDQ